MIAYFIFKNIKIENMEKSSSIPATVLLKTNVQNNFRINCELFSWKNYIVIVEDC